MMSTLPLVPDHTVRTTCPYCGVGCQMQLHIKDNLIYRGKTDPPAERDGATIPLTERGAIKDPTGQVH